MKYTTKWNKRPSGTMGNVNVKITLQTCSPDQPEIK